MSDAPDDGHGSGGGFGSCPVPIGRYDAVVLGHGSGGRLSADLLSEVFLRGYGERGPEALEDQATLSLDGLEAPAGSDGSDGSDGSGGVAARIAMTTDAFVVHPRFFPGGDIGKLAVFGTVNDLAVGGARPRWLSAAFILEEGLAMQELARVVASVRAACERADVRLVTGDTKVVDRGKADGLFITTSGVGVVPPGRALSASAARPGDVVLVSGTMGDHGVTIMSVREGLEFDSPLQSDAAPLSGLVEAILEVAPDTRCMRDPTRGGLASALNEIAVASSVGIRLEEAAVPVHEVVRGACEMLGLDPLYVANEGKLLAVVPEAQADAALAAMRAHPLGRQASRVGRVVDERPGLVVLVTPIGTSRTLPLMSGELLPRIC